MITSKVMLVTPEQAALWLTKNTHNRPLQDARVQPIVADILAGRWQARNCTIAFFIDGTLGDGQHRLTALVKAGIAVECTVQFGYPMDTKFDENKPRTHADNLHIGGAKNCTVASAAIMTLVKYARNLDRHARISNCEADEIYARIQAELNSSILTVGHKGSPFRGGTGVAAHFVMSLVDQAKADELFARLADGEGLHRGDPALALRNRVVGAPDRSQIVATAPWAWHALARTWRAVLTHEKLVKLTILMPGKFVDVEGVSRETVASLLVA